MPLAGRVGQVSRGLAVAGRRSRVAAAARATARARSLVLRLATVRDEAPSLISTFRTVRARRDAQARFYRPLAAAAASTPRHCEAPAVRSPVFYREENISECGRSDATGSGSWLVWLEMGLSAGWAVVVAAWWCAAGARELDPGACAARFDVQRDKIIRTEESREMGARYLSELDVGSRHECRRLCCETDACDVFVYEEKVPYPRPPCLQRILSLM